MVAILNEAYFVGASKLEIEADDYTTAINSVKLTPNVPTTEYTDIGGGVQTFTGAPVWNADIGYAQDWKTPNSFSKKLATSTGQLITLKITPDDESDVVTIQVRLRPGGIGGKAGGVAEDTVQLPCTGQPVWTPAI